MSKHHLTNGEAYGDWHKDPDATLCGRPNIAKSEEIDDDCKDCRRIYRREMYDDDDTVEMRAAKGFFDDEVRDWIRRG